MVKPGDRLRFKPNERSAIPAQTVEVTRMSGDGGFWCTCRNRNANEVELLCYGDEAPGFGGLVPIEVPRAKQHDEISLEEWQAKARSPHWPRGG